MEAVRRRQRHVDELGTARPDDRLIGRIHRLGHDHLVARPGEALDGEIEAGLRPGHDDDIIGRARAPGAFCEPGGDRFPHLGIAKIRA